METGITGFSRTIPQLDDVIAYLWNVSNQHCEHFFEVVMAVIIKGDSKERNYIGLICGFTKADTCVLKLYNGLVVCRCVSNNLII